MSLPAGDILLSPQQTAWRLGFSRQHVMRLGSSVLALEERRAEHDCLMAEWSHDLDAMGAPAE